MDLLASAPEECRDETTLCVCVCVWGGGGGGGGAIWSLVNLVPEDNDVIGWSSKFEELLTG